LHADEEEGCGLGIVVGDWEPRNWVVTREIRAIHRNSVHLGDS